jgi:hypothetical protein
MKQLLQEILENNFKKLENNLKESQQNLLKDLMKDFILNLF